MLDPILEIWVRGIQQKIARLDPMFRTYVYHLANQQNPPANYINHRESILDEDDDKNEHQDRDIVSQLQRLDTQLNLLFILLDTGDSQPQQPQPTMTNNATLGNLLGTLKSILPVKQMVAMWFQTELLTDPESIYYLPNFGPDAWLEHDKKNGPKPTHEVKLKIDDI